MARIGTLTMPHWALGAICQLMVDLVRIQRTDHPSARPASAVVFAGDHGIVREKVSLYPQEVTAQMVLNFLEGSAAISVLCRQHDIPLYVADMGVAGEVATTSPQYLRFRFGQGTRNFLEGPAMDDDPMQQAVNAGRAVIDQLGEAHSPRVVLLGEMGIGNTAASAAIAGLLLGLPASQTVGRGTGLAQDGLEHKIEVVDRAIQRYWHCKDDPRKVLAAVGGWEIAGLVGAMLEAKQRRLVILLDGYVVSAAALIACRMDPEVRQFLIASHRSAEPGHRFLLEDLELQPLLDLGLRLGEASGSALAWPLMDSAAWLYQEMATFEQAGVARSSES